MSTNQMGFIPGREARDNTIKVINLHSWLSSSKKSGFFLSLNAEKAFNGVAWDYIEETLRVVGRKDNMLHLILALYTNPTAKVRANGCLSNAFSIHNGTHQVCPLSPLLYVLTLEHFLNRLRDNPNIRGLSASGREFKIAAFADDIYIFLLDPHVTLPNLLRDCAHFQKISNLKINFDKSYALNIFLPKDTVTLRQNNFPFIWKSKAITYLGIQLPASFSDLYALNFTPILASIKTDLQKWDVLSFSWFGRGAILKMNVLRRLLYIMQAIPIHIHPTYKDICPNKRPRIK